MPPTHLLYLHGFRSSPLSTKAQKMAVLMRDHYPQVQWWCPQLPPSPDAAMQLLCDGIEAWQREPGYGSMAVIGSSLGGFYATALAELLNCKAVLLNPAVEPARDLGRHIGEQTSWQNPAGRFFFEPAFVDELRALHAGPLKAPENYLAILAKGDEVLDWREMQARYAGAKLRLLEGGDHALSDFDEHLPAILDFLGLR
ncbi:MAG: alpha/beta fold hydrolase [Polaromonas sp.]|nr:alpha/beta fold hydrolase [Polaromonas sp.]